jgi:hypothetical protein
MSQIPIAEDNPRGAGAGDVRKVMAEECVRVNRTLARHRCAWEMTDGIRKKW